MREKEKKFQQVEAAALELVASKGGEKLSFSMLAKKAGVSRAWIYKNYGASRDTVLGVAAKVIGERFAELDLLLTINSLHELKREFRDGARKTLLDLEETPWIPQIYFDYCGRPGILGDTIRRLESGYVQRTMDYLIRFGCVAERAKEVSLASLKLRMAVSHAWCCDKNFRKLGEAAATNIMMAVFDDIFTLKTDNDNS